MKILITTVASLSAIVLLLQVCICTSNASPNEGASSKNGSKNGNKTLPDPSSNIPKNPNENVFCAKCSHCETPPPETRFVKRTDPRGISYCYTKQFNENGLVVIERGVMRPRNSVWNNKTIHDRCPALNYLTKKKIPQYCFCSEYGCNTERTWINGEVIYKTARKAAKPKIDETRVAYADV